MRKPKKGQSQTPNIVQERDQFQTPNYAVDLLFPFLNRKQPKVIWECAAGSGRIVRRLELAGYKVLATDIVENKRRGIGYGNFLSDIRNIYVDAIVTNPPYSLKKKFYLRCMELDVAWALLIPADYSAWIIDIVRNGAEKIIPTRRIDYITPNVLDRIKAKTGRQYKRVDDVPSSVLAKFSTSQFHSMWLTWGLGIGRSETFVELSLDTKRNNV